MDWTYCEDGLPYPNDAVFFCVYFDATEDYAAHGVVFRGQYKYMVGTSTDYEFAVDGLPSGTFRAGRGAFPVYAWMPATPLPAELR